jgi:hypothetical protein
MMSPKSNKEEGGFLVARWVGAALVVLALFAVLAAAQRVYVYEVESDVPITEDVPHVPGICWRFGEQLLVVWVPRETVPGRLYDRTYFLLVVPADARPNQRTEAEAFLKTPDGTYPVVFREPDGCIKDILAHSIEEALTILKQLGLQPEYRGKAELRTDKTDLLNADRESPAKTASAFPQVVTLTTATVTQTSATTVTQTYVVETTPAWAVIGVLVALLAVVAGLAFRRRCTSFSSS